MRQAAKLESLGILAGGIAHDFNNLLTVINGESDLALSELPDGHPLKDTLGRILDAGNRAARLTSQLLAFSRKQVVSPAVVDIAAQVRAIAPMIRRLIGEDIALSVDNLDDAAAARVRIDPGQFEQVLLNLAVNARDAMPGGGALMIRARSSESHDDIDVIDTGDGIPPEIQPRIFEPFFTTKAHGKGTGLGLATVYSIVSQNGGTLDVESAPGCGATFTIRLPQSAADCAAEDERSAVPGGTETIVLVEDEDGIRELTARMLRSMGYSVIEMTSSTQALEWLRAPDRPAHLLLSDVVMPGLTGPELAAAIAPIRPCLPVLYVSGYADEKLASAVLANPERFLAKPYQQAALSEKVRRILDSVAVA
jgi:CheY-like chemotaxis protein